MSEKACAYCGRTDVKLEKDDGRRRFIDLWEQLKAVNKPSGERHQIFPANDDRFLRVLRKNLERNTHAT